MATESPAPPAPKRALPTKGLRPAAKPSARAAAKPVPAKKAAATPAAKTDKAKKPKLVRDSYTIPKTEYAVLDELKVRAAKAGSAAKKSELLRAGIKALAGLDDAAFAAAMKAVPAIKTGRPAKT